MKVACLPSWNMKAPSINSISLTSCCGPARRRTTIICEPVDTNVCGKIKTPLSLRAFLVVGEHNFHKLFLCPLCVTSIISITLRHDGDFNR